MFFFHCFKEQNKTRKTRKQNYTFSDINKCAHHMWRKLELHFLSVILLFKIFFLNISLASRKCFMCVKNCHILTELYGFHSKVGTFNIDFWQHKVSQIFRHRKFIRSRINNKTRMFHFKTWKQFRLKGSAWAKKGYSLYVLISKSKLRFKSYCRGLAGFSLAMKTACSSGKHFPRATSELRAQEQLTGQLVTFWTSPSPFIS